MLRHRLPAARLPAATENPVGVRSWKATHQRGSPDLGLVYAQAAFGLSVAAPRGQVNGLCPEGSPTQMDNETIRQQLAAYQGELVRLDHERQMILKIIEGIQALAALNQQRAQITQPSLPFPPESSPQPISSGRPKGTIALRQAVFRVIREGRGRPIPIREILARAQAMGAVSESKNPLRVVDSLAYNWQKAGEPVVRVSPSSWKWDGEDLVTDEEEASSE